MKKKIQPPKQHIVILTRHNKAQLIKMPPGEKRTDQGTILACGSLESVKAAANLLAPGDWRLIECMTPTGMIDCHLMYVNAQNGNKAVCAFCGKE